ncbi:MAG: S1C family serine protease [Atribacterota bacterium]
MNNTKIFIFISCLFILLSQNSYSDIPDLVETIQPAVVVITTYDEDGDEIGMGSGFFIENGNVITNRHVLMGASKAEVKTYDDKTFQIKEIRGEDKDGDLLMLSLDIPGEYKYQIAVSTKVPRVGEKIFVISSPMGLEQTVSDGIVSAVRDIPDFGEIIQLTAPISLGSSGSPVVNMEGQVIGVATFLMVEGQNLNFAVPGERIEKLDVNEGKTLLTWKEEVEEGLALIKEYYSDYSGIDKNTREFIGGCVGRINRTNRQLWEYSADYDHNALLFFYSSTDISEYATSLFKNLYSLNKYYYDNINKNEIDDIAYEISYRLDQNILLLEFETGVLENNFDWHYTSEYSKQLAMKIISNSQRLIELVKGDININKLRNLHKDKDIDYWKQIKSFYSP